MREKEFLEAGRGRIYLSNVSVKMWSPRSWHCCSPLKSGVLPYSLFFPHAKTSSSFLSPPHSPKTVHIPVFDTQSSLLLGNFHSIARKARFMCLHENAGNSAVFLMDSCSLLFASLSHGCMLSQSFSRVEIFVSRAGLLYREVRVHQHW